MIKCGWVLYASLLQYLWLLNLGVSVDKLLYLLGAKCWSWFLMDYYALLSRSTKYDWQNWAQKSKEYCDRRSVSHIFYSLFYAFVRKVIIESQFRNIQSNRWKFTALKVKRCYWRFNLHVLDYCQWLRIRDDQPVL